MTDVSTNTPGAGLVTAPPVAPNPDAAVPPPPSATRGEQPKDPPAPSVKPAAVVGAPVEEAEKPGEAPPRTFEPIEHTAIKELLPKGLDVSEDQAKGLSDVLNGAKDTKDLVSKMLQMHKDILEGAAESLAAEHNTMMNSWVEEIKSSPEFAGEKFGPAVAQANEIAERFGGKEFLKLLSTTGAGNSIHTLRFLTKIAKAVPQEGTPTTAGSPSVPKKSLADRLFQTQEPSK